MNDLLRHPRLPQAPLTALAPLLDAGLHTIKQRALVFILSDFITTPGWKSRCNC